MAGEEEGGALRWKRRSWCGEERWKGAAVLEKERRGWCAAQVDKREVTC